MAARSGILSLTYFNIFLNGAGYERTSYGYGLANLIDVSCVVFFVDVSGGKRASRLALPSTQDI